MSHLESEHRLDRLFLTLLALSLPSSDQLTLFPSVAAIPTELDAQLRDELESLAMTNFENLTEQQKSAVDRVDDALDRMPSGPEGWSETALVSDTRWETVRSLASAALHEGRWPSVDVSDLRILFGPPRDDAAFEDLVRRLRV